LERRGSSGGEFVQVEDITPFIADTNLRGGEFVGSVEADEVGGDAFHTGDGIGEDGVIGAEAVGADEDEGGAGRDGAAAEAEEAVGCKDWEFAALDAGGPGVVAACGARAEVEAANLHHAVDPGGMDGKLAACETDNEVLS